MKLAIPLKTNKEDSAISPLFGKAKYFAFINGSNIKIEKNELKSGSSIVDWFKSKGVEAVIVQSLGYSPYEMLRESGIEIFYAGDGRVLLKDVLERLKRGELSLVDDTNINKLIKHKHK